MFKWLAHGLVTFKLHALHFCMNALNLVLNFQIGKTEKNETNSTCHLQNEYLKWRSKKMHNLATSSWLMRIHKLICKIKTVGSSKFGDCLLARMSQSIKQMVLKITSWKGIKETVSRLSILICGTLWGR